jgi:hypothetical protein
MGEHGWIVENTLRSVQAVMPRRRAFVRIGENGGVLHAALPTEALRFHRQSDAEAFIHIADSHLKGQWSAVEYMQALQSMLPAAQAQCQFQGLLAPAGASA